MAFTGVSLKCLIKDFNKREVRPHGKLLTLSRYSMAFSRDIFNDICQAENWDIEISEEESFLYDELVFKSLGFNSIESMDYSRYEGADIIHDLNDIHIPKELENKYDYILDGGTLEHVFHLPNALGVIFKMLKINGTFIFDQPTFFGLNHGYYNFSPIMYYEYFKANNYKINTLVPYAVSGETNTFIPYAIKNDFDYNVDPGINDIYVNDMRVHVPSIEDDFYHLVWGSVTKTQETTFDVIPYQGSYVENWKSSEEIYNYLEFADRNSVYIYGTGNVARSILLKISNKHSKNYMEKIAGFLSNSPDEIEKIFCGYKVYGLEKVNGGNLILIASKIYQDTIYERIRHLEKDGVRIIKLY